MIGNVKLNGCTPLGGWWTDLQKAITSGAMTAAQLLNLWKAGNITQEQYFELEKARIAASGASATTDNTKTILIVGGVALAALALGIIGTRKR
jgi:voltage-gated potassium channel Kch